MAASGQHPRIETFTIPVPAVATAGNDASTPVLIAPFDGSVFSVQYITPTAITGANTNTRKTEVVNKGAAGSGSTVAATLQYDSGVNTVAYVPKTIPLSGTAANRDFVAGDVLAWNSTHILTGIADPGGTLVLKVSRA